MSYYPTQVYKDIRGLISDEYPYLGPLTRSLLDGLVVSVLKNKLNIIPSTQGSISTASSFLLKAHLIAYKIKQKYNL